MSKPKVKVLGKHVNFGNEQDPHRAAVDRFCSVGEQLYSSTVTFSSSSSLVSTGLGSVSSSGRSRFIARGM